MCERIGNAIVCVRRGRRRRCGYCRRLSDRLCDYPKDGGGTCDAPLCRAHAKRVGPELDYCPAHADAPPPAAAASRPKVRVNGRAVECDWCGGPGCAACSDARVRAGG